MSRFKRTKNKSNKKSSVSIDKKIVALNKELKKTGMLSEEPTMTTSNVYSTSTNVPYDPGGEFPVPDPSGVTEEGFTQPVSGNPDDPSNWPDAYTDNSWMFNPNEVYGETNRPIFKTMDQGVIAAYNAANPGSDKYPFDGAGIVFGAVAFGTGVGYAKNGHYKQVLSPGLFGDGSTNLVPPGSPYGAPYFGLFTAYRVSIEEAAVIMAMTGAYMDAGGYDPSKAMPVSLWRFHSTLHDGPYENWSGKKYTTGTGQRYVLSTFFLHRAQNTYHENPVPEHQTNVQTRGTEDPPIYPGPIANLLGLGQRGLEFLLNRIKGAAETAKNIIQKAGMPIQVATSVGKNEPVNAPEPSDAEKQEFFNNLDPNSIFNPDHPFNIQTKGVPINSDGKVNYADEVIYVDPNGNVQSNVGPNGEKEYYEKNTTTENSIASTIGTRGQSQAQIYWSEEKGKWMFAFEDHAYDNLNTTDEGETVNVATKASEIAHQNADEKFGRNKGEVKFPGTSYETKAPDKTSPNTGAMSNYPCNSTACIRGDSILKFEMPVDEIDNEEIRNKIYAEIAAGKKQNESYISESVRLGHFEPEELNVDIEDLRKGIMPEYPKQPPAKMIDGYHQKSPLKPKLPEDDPLVKITKLDLIRNHRLKPNEADEMMKMINQLNDYIKKHPEDLIHAQMRYPKDDPRLAELNWKMDQMLEAGSKYMDSNFKENKKLFNRAMDRTKNNIKLTDPKYVQQHYDELRGTMKSKPTINRKSPSRFFKKPVKKKSSMEEINDKIKKLDKDLLI